MAFIEFEKFNFNQFYKETPTVLKYFLVISIVVLGGYWFYSKKIDDSHVKELEKIEESINTTYALIDKFEDFQKAQYVYNDEILEYLENVYDLVEELNYNTNQKFNAILEAEGNNSDVIIEKILLLNESFEKLQKAYKPKEFEDRDTEYNNTVISPIDNNKDTSRDLKIGVKKLDKK